MKIGDPEAVTDTTELEAFTLLQLEAEGYVTGARRPDKSNKLEDDFDTDIRFDTYNPSKIRCAPTAIDVKVPIDPQSIIRKTFRSLEQQATDIVNSVEFQQIGAKTGFNESLLHVINLFRIRPVDRQLFIWMFKAKAATKTIDLNRVIFLNIRDDSIY